MRQLSSPWTCWHKRGSPLLWFGFLALFVLFMLLGVIRQQTPIEALLIPLALAVGSYVVMRLLRIFSFVDEVWLDGDQLIVRNGKEEDRFPVSNIHSAWASRWTNPERIVLTLEVPCRFGHEVVFTPPFRWLHSTRHPLARELTRRAEEARAASMSTGHVVAAISRPDTSFISDRSE